MKRILIPLCIVVGSHVAYGQRSYQFDAPDRLFVEGKELFSLKIMPVALTSWRLTNSIPRMPT